MTSRHSSEPRYTLQQRCVDLTTPLTIIKPDTGKRFQSLLVINEDHYIKLVAYKPGRYVLTQKEAGRAM